MTATRLDILGYIGQAQAKGARWLIVGLDTFDYDNFPVFVMEDQDPNEELQGLYRRGNSADEVYDLKLSISDQMAERRAWHLPSE